MTAGDEESKAAPDAFASPRQPTGGGSSTEFEPPLACVRRMLKNTLPSNTNVGKDACSAFSRSCGIFVIYLTACANDFARENKRQTITANDILAAVNVCVHMVFILRMQQLGSLPLKVPHHCFFNLCFIGTRFSRIHTAIDSLYRTASQK